MVSAGNVVDWAMPLIGQMGPFILLFAAVALADRLSDLIRSLIPGRGRGW